MSVDPRFTLLLILTLTAGGCNRKDDDPNPLTNPFTPSAAQFDATGAWDVTLSPLSYNPENSGISNPYDMPGFTDSGTLNFFQAGAAVGVDIDTFYTTGAQPLSGSVNGAAYSFGGTYPVRGADHETDAFLLTLTSSFTATGSMEWRIVAGTQSCSGVNSITAIRN